ncbi:MAG: hypothetical protein ACI4D0_11675 [Lachnospira sp.]
MENVQTFEAWTSNNSLPDREGYFYLTQNVTIDSQWIPVNGTVLCLNGKTITGTYGNALNNGFINVATTFTLTDCQTNPGIIVKDSTDGSCFDVNGTFNMYGGSIEHTNSTKGVGVSVGMDDKFNMYGGSITNNSSGGVNNYGTFIMSGGSIEGNTASQGAGLYNAKIFSMSGGSITGNTATNSCGGVQNGSFASISVSGTAKITGNQVGTNNNNLNLPAGIKITINNALINGAAIGVTVANAPTSGNPVDITNAGTSDYSSYFFSDNTNYKIYNDNNTVKLKVNTDPVTPSDTHQNHCICGASHTNVGDHTAEKTPSDEGKAWTEWTATDSLPSSEGYYYLKSDVTLNSQWTPVNGTVLCLNGHKITGDIYNLIKVNQNVIFTLTDCESGKIVTNDKTTVYVESGGIFNMYGGSFSGQNRGTQFIVRVNGTFNMYGGSISENTFGYGASEAGSAVKVSNDGVFNMYGGSISQNKGSHCGAGVQNYGRFNMSGGVISRNETTDWLGMNESANGGGVYNDGTFIMSGGKISGNKAARNGGGVYNNGFLSLSGGVTILSNKVGSNDNNLFLPADKKIKLNANVLTGGTGETHIGVTTATLPTDGSSLIIADIDGDIGNAACGNRFFSDNQDYWTFVHITADAKTVELEKKPNFGGINPPSGGTNPPSVNTNPSGGGSDNQDVGSDNADTLSTFNPAYQIINGANSTWMSGGSEALTIRGNGDFDKFTGVKVDGKLLDQSNYTAQEGSTIITLKASYLDALSAGNHSIEILWTDGSARTSFTISANTYYSKDVAPKTGDSAPIVWLFLLTCLSGTGLIIIGKKTKRT